MARPGMMITIDTRPWREALDEVCKLVADIGVDSLPAHLRCKVERMLAEGWVRLEGSVTRMEALPEPEMMALLAELRSRVA